MKTRLVPAIGAAALFLSACSDPNTHAMAVAVLVDVSGTYVDQKPAVVSMVKSGIVPQLEPGDSLVVIVIDGKSYEKENVIAAMHLDVRPSQSNAQKLAFSKRLDQFVTRPEKAPHTDIRGAMMLASEHLKETGAGNQIMVLFSDMEEDLPRGSTRDLAPAEFAGMRLIAMNVKRLAADSANPTAYRKRLAGWETRATASGAAEWRVILDPERLVAQLQKR